MRRIKSIMTYLLIGALWPAAMPMGETAESTTDTVNFVNPPEEGGYDISVVDGKGTSKEHTIELTQASLGGVTTLDKLYAKDEDANIGIDFENIKTLKVLHNEFPGEDYRGKDLFVVSVIDNIKGGEHKILFPSHVVICGIDKDSGFTKAWLLRNVDEVHITGKTPGATPPSVVKTQKVALAAKKVAKKG
jgi:hypothetical protein